MAISAQVKVERLVPRPGGGLWFVGRAWWPDRIKDNPEECFYAILVSGDGDFVELVEHVQDRAKHVWLRYFEQHCSEDLTRAVDRHQSLEGEVTEHCYRLFSPGS